MICRNSISGQGLPIAVLVWAPTCFTFETNQGKKRKNTWACYHTYIAVNLILVLPHYTYLRDTDIYLPDHRPIKFADLHSSRKCLFVFSMRSVFVLVLTYLWAVDASAWAANFESLALSQDPSVTSGVMSSDESASQDGLSEGLSTSYHPENALPDSLFTPGGNDMPSINESPVASGSNSIGPGPELTAAKTECSSIDNHPQGGVQARKQKRRRVLLERGESCPAPLPDAPTSTNQHPETERKPIDTPENQSPTGTEQSELDLLEWPDLFKIPTHGGGSPACFEHTRGLLPIGVCDSLGIGPVPSRFDVYENKNPDIIPKAWKLNYCFLCAYSLQFNLFSSCKTAPYEGTAGLIQ